MKVIKPDNSSENNEQKLYDIAFKMEMQVPLEYLAEEYDRLLRDVRELAESRGFIVKQSQLPD